MRVLPAALRRNGRQCPFNDLQQCLLHAFTGYVSGDGDVLTLAGDLVDLVDIDDASLGTVDIIVRCLDQLQQDVLDILTDIACLCEGGGICDGKRHVQQLRQSLCKIGLTGTGGTEHKDIALLQFDITNRGPSAVGQHSLIVIVYCDRERLLRFFLSDHILVQELLDLSGGAKIDLTVSALRLFVCKFLLHDLRAYVDTLITDVDPARSCDQFPDLVLGLIAE